MHRHEVESGIDRITGRDGWMTQYNMDHKFSSPWRVHETMKNIAYLPDALRTLEGQLAKSLGNFFDHYTVDEWLEQHMTPLQQKVTSIMEKARILTEKTEWPRRPLEAAKEDIDKKIHRDNEGDDNPLEQMPK